jgi:DNA primase
MVNQALVAIVNSVLGTGKASSKGNYTYVCPFHTSNTPGKRKLEINFTENEKGENPWHCWSCNVRGKKLTQLFKALNAPQEKIIELKPFLKNFTAEVRSLPGQNEKLTLPKEFISLINPPSSIMAKHASVYIKKRGVTQEDIIKYNLGYCEEGKYANHIIIPSYDETGVLNYFTARSFEKDNKSKKNPTVSRDIIPFGFFVNWDLPLVLCEGPFDAIAIKRNAIPLLGKQIQPNLMKKIVMSSVSKIYIALDKDAQKQALDFCERLMNEGKEIYLIDMEDKDPSEMGFQNFTNLIQNTHPLTFSELLNKKFTI